MIAIIALPYAALLASTASGAATLPSEAAASRPAAVSVKSGLPWIEDDYTRALAEAKRRGVPLFVEAWAPW